MFGVVKGKLASLRKSFVSFLDDVWDLLDESEDGNIFLSFVYRVVGIFICLLYLVTTVLWSEDKEEHTKEEGGEVSLL